MDGFREDVGHFQTILQALPLPDVRKLETSLRELSQAQKDHIRAVLRNARASAQTPPNVHQTLEYLLDRWRSHGLGLKLAFMARIDSLAGDQRWPDDVRGECPLLARYTQSSPRSTTSTPPS